MMVRKVQQTRECKRAYDGKRAEGHQLIQTIFKLLHHDNLHLRKRKIHCKQHKK